MTSHKKSSSKWDIVRHEEEDLEGTVGTRRESVTQSLQSKVASLTDK